MKFKHYLITAASCMAILGSGVSYADATASWHATSEHHRKAPKEDGKFIEPINVDGMLKRLDNTLTGDLALTDEQRKNIQALADNANKQIDMQRVKLSDAQKRLDELYKLKIASAEQFNALHTLLNQRALAMSDIMFAKQQFLMSIDNSVLSDAQSKQVEAKLEEKGERYRQSPNASFTAQRQPMMGG